MAESNVERFAMQRGTILQLPATRPLEVTSSGGTVWLTLDNDPRDLMLGHGERVLLEISGRVLAYALDDAVLEISSIAQPVSGRALRRSKGWRW